MTPTLTAHAAERARQRLGWPGSDAALEALLRSYLARQEYPIPAAGRWRLCIPAENLVAVFRGSTVVTLYPLKEAAA